MRISSPVFTSLIVVRPHAFAVPQNRHPIRNPGQFLHSMRNVDHSHPRLPKPANDPKKILHFAFGERRSRLIQDQNLRIPPQRRGDLHQLLLRHGQLAYQGIGRNFRANPLQKPAPFARRFFQLINRSPNEDSRRKPRFSATVKSGKAPAADRSPRSPIRGQSMDRSSRQFDRESESTPYQAQQRR